MQMEKKEPEKDLKCYLPLYQAALRGDWECARKFFDQDPEAVTAKINHVSETALHVATRTGKAINFLKELLELISIETLPTLRDLYDQTALHSAALCGTVEAAKLLVQKNPALTNCPSNKEMFPIHFAAGYANKDVVSYLLTVTRDDIDPNPFADKSGANLLNAVIVAEFYDLALYLIQLYPKLATALSLAGYPALGIIAGKSLSFQGGRSLKVLGRLIYSCVPVKSGNLYKQTGKEGSEDSAYGCQGCLKDYCCPLVFGKLNFSGCQNLSATFWKLMGYFVPYVRSIQHDKFMHQQALQLVRLLCIEVAKLDYSTAAYFFGFPATFGTTLGNSVIVKEILESFPPARWTIDHEGRNIFLLAVANRRENIFNLLCQMFDHTSSEMHQVDVQKNNILHLAGKLAPPSQLNLVSGAALQMQRELQWYKEVEKYVRPLQKDWKNSNGRTPAEEFSAEHKDLVKEGEKWMKDTANSCTVAATLIATVAFAAAITVPGGNNGDSGFPIFSKDTAFNIFAIFDALSLFSSAASLLMFLSIMTARYAENDFLFSLPSRLILGLVTLFLSITSMMMAFSATIYLVFGHRRAWTIVPIAALACLPVTLFATLQFPLLVDMIRSTYGPGIFGKRSNRELHMV